MKHGKSFLLLSLVAALAACSSYKSAENVRAQAEVNVPGEFNLEGRLLNGQPVAAWWSQLDDDALKNLVQDALTHNQDIRIAEASLREARALLRNARLHQLPSVEADVAYAREKTSADLLQPGAETIRDIYTAGFDASWEVDLFGRVRNQVRLGEAQVAARAADVRAAHVSVAAEVVANYVMLRGNQYLLQVAQDSVKNQQESLAFIQRLLEVGRGNQLDIARAQGQLDLTRASIPPLQAQVNEALNRLAVLTRRDARQLQSELTEPRSLPSLPTTLAVDDPVQLLRRRPDIQYAEQALVGAVAEYNVHVADLYPRVSIDGSLGYLSTEWSRLGEDPTETFIFSPRIHWAAFNLGRVHARIKAADARTQVRLTEFEQRVALALEETDNALQHFSREEERRLRLREAAHASATAARLAQQKFQIGSGDFLSVLDAQREQLNINARLAQSETQLLLNMVAIYKALGGGWETYAGTAQLELSF